MAMRYRAKFPLAVGATTAGMTGMFLLIGCVGYARLGQDFDHSKPVTGSPSVHGACAWGAANVSSGVLGACWSAERAGSRAMVVACQGLRAAGCWGPGA